MLAADPDPIRVAADAAASRAVTMGLIGSLVILVVQIALSTHLVKHCGGRK